MCDSMPPLVNSGTLGLIRLFLLLRWEVGSVSCSNGDFPSRLRPKTQRESGSWPMIPLFTHAERMPHAPTSAYG